MRFDAAMRHAHEGAEAARTRDSGRDHSEARSAGLRRRTLEVRFSVDELRML
jgi:hypothetical protein